MLAGRTRITKIKGRKQKGICRDLRTLEGRRDFERFADTRKGRKLRRKKKKRKINKQLYIYIYFFKGKNTAIKITSLAHD